jgi:hypothetical protein
MVPTQVGIIADLNLNLFKPKQKWTPICHTTLEKIVSRKEALAKIQEN